RPRLDRRQPRRRRGLAALGRRSPRDGTESAGPRGCRPSLRDAAGTLASRRPGRPARLPSGVAPRPTLRGLAVLEPDDAELAVDLEDRLLHRRDVIDALRAQAGGQLLGGQALAATVRPHGLAQVDAQ